MAKIDLMLTSGLTATDGSMIASGATLKFNSEFYAGTTDINIKLKLYRNRELFESCYTNTECGSSRGRILCDYTTHFIWEGER